MTGATVANNPAASVTASIAVQALADHPRMAAMVASSAPYWERPCAGPGLLSYRYAGPYGFIMIGAKGDGDAMREAARSCSLPPRPEALERWNGSTYAPITEAR